jgi:hypothetical protein
MPNPHRHFLNFPDDMVPTDELGFAAPIADPGVAMEELLEEYHLDGFVVDDDDASESDYDDEDGEEEEFDSYADSDADSDDDDSDADPTWEPEADEIRQQLARAVRLVEDLKNELSHTKAELRRAYQI